MPRPFVPAAASGGTPSPTSRVFVVRRAEVLITTDEPGAGIPAHEAVAELGVELGQPHYLGALHGVDCFAFETHHEGEAPDGHAFEPLRPLWGRLDEHHWGVAGRALQVVEWDQTHRYCGRCGTPTELAADERARRCPACGLSAFPRVAPAVIVRVTRDDQILLAHGTRFPGVFYSVLAGFAEPGESLEECVAREVEEEVGIEVDDIAYFGSQPWPFPHSLMIGFTARWAAGEIAIDPNEIVDARWFARDELPPLPPRLSIARRLIDEYLESAA